MLATSNLFEPVPVLIEAIEIAGIFGPLRFDFIESGMCQQDGHKSKTAQHGEPYAPDRLMCWVAYRR